MPVMYTTIVCGLSEEIYINHQKKKKKKFDCTRDVNGLLTEKAAIISGSCNKALMSGIPPAPAAPPEEIVQIHETLIISHTDNSNY